MRYQPLLTLSLHEYFYLSHPPANLFLIDGGPEDNTYLWNRGRIYKIADNILPLDTFYIGHPMSKPIHSVGSLCKGKRYYAWTKRNAFNPLTLSRVSKERLMESYMKGVWEKTW